MGGKGSGGHNKKTIEEHLRDGTYRHDRHGPVPERLEAKDTGKEKPIIRRNVSAKRRKDRRKLEKWEEGAGVTRTGKRGRPKKVKPPIDCPTWFDDIARAEFWRVCKVLHDRGTLKDVNHATLEGYCSAYSKAVKADKVLNKHGFTVQIPARDRDGQIIKGPNGEAMVESERKRIEVDISQKSWALVRIFAVELDITSSRGHTEPAAPVLTEMERILQDLEQGHAS